METKTKKKNSKKKIIITAVVLIIVIAVIFAFMKSEKEKSAANMKMPSFTEATVQVMPSIQTTMSSSGTLKPADQYSVTASVSGEILECTFEEGDVLTEDDVMYVVDTSDIENTIDRAQISFDRTKRSYDKIVESLNDLNVHTEYDGTIISVSVKVGDEIMQGAEIARLRDASVMHLTVPFASADAKLLSVGDTGEIIIDGSFESRACKITDIDSFDSVLDTTPVRYVEMTVDNTEGGIFDITKATAVFGDTVCLAPGIFEYNKTDIIKSEVSGTVVRVVKKGSEVKAGELICVLESESLEDNFKDAQASLDDAQLSFDNTKEKLDDYTIKAPITGTVIEKYSKLGDNLDSTKGQTTMALIYDLSHLEFDMALDELDISRVKVGQKVIISCDALDITGIEGVITKVSVVGTTSYNSTTYPVTVEIHDVPDGLLAGMNVDAQLVISEATNALAVPTGAIQRGNVVYVKDENAANKQEGDNAPEGFRSVKVETGVSNDNFIEIISDEIKEGDIVYVPQMVRSSDETNMFGMGGMPMGGMAMGGMPSGGMPSGGMPSGGMPSGGMPSGGSRPSGMGGGMR